MKNNSIRDPNGNSHDRGGKKFVFVQSLSHVRLCNAMDCSLPSSSVLGILQARILEWVALPFSRGSSQPRNQIGFSCIAGGLACLVKNPPGSAGDAGSIPGWEDPLEKEMATHSSILARRIPWIEEPGGLHPWCHRVGHD